ncbi:PEP-CTERM sorting domain-containing protein [Bowmanella dokdonensis]|uniref:PEP-CTERM sorting domain-containing protein n=1 Tax=Bowmanella dokdonensis TaxID=751969 RepID=A0A939IPY2_9ALTE|nr:PEP-CTERM sorting domain-containing protein [Bowmanella dokdonensis]MBN7824042.1 PEP-CTERM sorting domain-containing protein [Bowmanella dokdonensis]
MSKLRSLLAVTTLLCSFLGFSQQANATIITDPLEDLIVSQGDLDWIWASPCDGGCSQLVTDWQYAGGLYDDALNTQLAVGVWRFATDLEFAGLPDVYAFQNKCASSYFDNTYNHCDFGDLTGGYISNVPTGGVNELLLVRSTNLVSAQVSEPAALTLFALGLLGIAARRRQK